MCSFTWLVQIATWPEQYISCLHLEKMMTASKLQNERLVKYVNIKIWQRLLVHIIIRVYSINICIRVYAVLLSVVIERVNMLMVTIVTGGIKVIDMKMSCYILEKSYVFEMQWWLNLFVFYLSVSINVAKVFYKMKYIYSTISSLQRQFRTHIHKGTTTHVCRAAGAYPDNLTPALQVEEDKWSCVVIIFQQTTSNRVKETSDNCLNLQLCPGAYWGQNAALEFLAQSGPPNPVCSHSTKNHWHNPLHYNLCFLVYMTNSKYFLRICKWDSPYVTYQTIWHIAQLLSKQTWVVPNADCFHGAFLLVIYSMCLLAKSWHLSF